MTFLMLPRRLLAVAGVSALLLTAACGSDEPADGSASPTAPTDSTADPSETPTSEQPTETPAETPTETEPPATGVTHADPAARAAQGALVAVPGAVISVDHERGNVWSVLVRTTDGAGTEVYVDATDGAIQRQRNEPLPRVARSAAPSFTAVEAIDVALGALPNGEVRELDLGRERGVVVWEIEVRAGGITEFYIDASPTAPSSNKRWITSAARLLPADLSHSPSDRSVKRPPD
ncbi:MAG: PepSY domain-containing protein [Nocardioidaceae bacterium]|nr:MAG: PepSY domain-containing protein [Nocardioidaceae bacterium]